MLQMMVVIDVHMAAFVKIGGINESDWYGILRVDPIANKVVVKKKCRELALLVHLDKNKLFGVESAIKIIGI